jgi:RNA polymerase sigma-70 factor (ECF subfamily)
VTTQPELPELAPPPARPALRLAPPPPESDVDFDGFVRSYEARLRRLVLRRIGDLCEAEEITQETLLRAYQHRESFSSEDELMAWSTVVAQRLVIDRVRVRGRSVAVADVPEGARLGRDTAEIVVAKHEARAALESLEAIPARQAAILWAREVEGLHYEEIAERFGISEPAVRSLLHRGRKALRKEFKDRTGSLPLGGLAPFAPWLLALKAVGKVRGAAKTMGRSSVSAAAALSISALVVSGVGGGLGATRERPAPVRIEVADGGSTFVMTAAANGPDAAQNARAHRDWSRRALRPAPSRTGGAGSPGVLGNLHGTKTCVNGIHRGVCAEVSDDPWSATTIQVGPDLPANPTGLGNVKISQDQVDCATLRVPTVPGVVSCTEHPPNEERSGGSGPILPPSAPSAPEGALR